MDWQGVAVDGGRACYACGAVLVSPPADLLTLGGFRLLCDACRGDQGYPGGSAPSLAAAPMAVAVDEFAAAIDSLREVADANPHLSPEHGKELMILMVKASQLMGDLEVFAEKLSTR